MLWSRYDGIRYRGPDECSRAQQLTLFALFFQYTGDPTGIFTRHHDKIMVMINQLRAVRARCTRPLANVSSLAAFSLRC